MQTELCAAGEHAVGLVHPLGNQVIDQNTQIGFITPGHPWTFTTTLQRGVQPGKQTLCCCLFIASRAIDLARKKQALNLLGLKAALERARVKVVVLDGVTRSQDVRVLHALHAAHQFVLNVEWQAGGDAVGIELVGSQSFGFQKNLVAFLVGKAVDFVFHARAVAWSHALDLAGEHGAAIKTAANDLVGARIGMRDPAGHLLGVHGAVAHEAEHGHFALVHASGHAVTRLLVTLTEVDGATINARRRAGLEAALGQLQLLQASRQ